MERGRLFIVHFVLQVAIYIARRLEVQACFRIVEFLEQARIIHLIERFLHRQAAFLHKTGDEVFYYLLLHILKFCLRNVHCLISLSIALCVIDCLLSFCSILSVFADCPLRKACA